MPSGRTTQVWTIRSKWSRCSAVLMVMSSATVHLLVQPAIPDAMNG